MKKMTLQRFKSQGDHYQYFLNLPNLNEMSAYNSGHIQIIIILSD